MNYLSVKVFYCFLIVLFISGCKKKEPAVNEEQYRLTKEKMVDVNRILVKKDEQRIKGYIERQNLVMDVTETGLWYNISNKGAGIKAETGKRISLSYSVRLMDGRECYNSKKDGLKSFKIGKGGVESGLEEGVLMLNEGSKATFIMPPHLAHGLTGDGNCIPARAIIIYEVEVLSIK